MEKQVDHRISQESKVIQARIDIQKHGQFFAFVLGIAGIGLGAVGMITGHSFEGLAAFIASIGTLAGLFLWGGKSQRDERTEKAEIMARQQPNR